MTLTTKERIQNQLRKMCRFEKIKRSWVLTSLFATLIILTTPSKLIALSEKPVDVKRDLIMAFDSMNPIQSAYKISAIEPGESAAQKAERTERERIDAQNRARAEAEAKARVEVAAAEAKSREVVSRESRSYADPTDFKQIYQDAGAAYGVDPRLLEAVHQVETGKSGSTSKSSYAGAVGPMQFLPSTWRSYGVDGNGDGKAEITNISDAIHSAARYLKACGYPSVKAALWGYNPSQSYYNKVTNVARSIGMPV